MSEKLTSSVTFKCTDNEKLELEAFAKEKDFSLSKFMRLAVMNYLAFSKDLDNSGGTRIGLTKDISDILDILNIWAITQYLKRIPLDELNRNIGSLVVFLEAQKLNCNPIDQYTPSFELVQQPKMLDITPRKTATKKAQPCDQLSLICHPTN
ncbi:hypothetical protein LVY74_00355 [Acinetobacter sp. ME22]|uniref:hypothetical protein n=1 Tax=Acinetobacter sp. ME22 TaxID=2904802 RepID=UPI001ED9DF4F|nr:hypothetical protein [Acinetobacter sp. ME22]MCG2572010.1 hypothetical protein [Acinetobacter sp. ME22]